MSKHRHDECCYPTYPAMYGYGMGGYGGYYGGSMAGYGVGGAMGIRWIYALLILIVIVLQFGRNHKKDGVVTANSCDDGAVIGTGFGKDNDSLIDNSVLFIIVVFLLILCAGCWWGSNSCGSGYGGGYGF